MSDQKATVKFGKEELRITYNTPNVYREDIEYENVRLITGEQYMMLSSYSPSALIHENSIKFMIGEQKYMLTSAKLALYGDGTGCGIGALYKVVKKTGTSGSGKKKTTFEYETTERDTELGPVVFFAVGCDHQWRAPKAGEWQNQPFGRCVTNYVCDKCGAKNSVDSSD